MFGRVLANGSNRTYGIASIPRIIKREYKDSQRYKWHNDGGLVISIYRIIALAVAGISTFLFDTSVEFLVTPVILFIGIGTYTIVTVLPLPTQRFHNIFIYGSIFIDICVCIFLFLTTGGIHSQFLMYTLTPLLAAIGILAYLFVFRTANGLQILLPKLLGLIVNRRMVEDSRANDRQIFYRELHDNAAQTISAVSWQVQLLRRRVNQMNINIQEIEELEELTQKSKYEIKQSLELLRNFDGHGAFCEQIKKYLENFKDNSGIDYKFVADNKNITLEIGTEFQIMCILQEALNNVNKHASARKVNINLHLNDKWIELDVIDDGKGFDVSKYQTHSQFGGQGIKKMRQRANSIGADLQIISTPASGTEVRIKIPQNTGVKNE